ncbi:MAG: hypothetical protein WBA44_07545 [Mesorhizobium sp.]
MSAFALTLAEFVVARGWLEREVVRRGGANLRAAIVDAAEFVALARFADTVRLVVPSESDADLHLLAAARNHLTPVETALDVVTDGSDDLEMPVDIEPGSRDLDAARLLELADQTLLVLFEFLCREIDDRDGTNLGASFVSPSEFWALNGAQCVLEKGSFYSVARDYREQLTEARRALADASVEFKANGSET